MFLALGLAGCGGATGPEGTGAGNLPFDGRSPLVPPAKEVRVLVELKRPSLAAQMESQSYSAGRQRLYVGSLGNEARALQSALRAKGVQLRKPLLFARVWNGFAATVDAKDLATLRSLGLRAEPVRWFYGAGGGSGTPEDSGQRTEDGARRTAGKPVVALLDSGVDRAAPGLRGRVVPGFDAVGGDRDPRPGGARESHGTEVAQVLAQALGPKGGRIQSIRVAGLQPDPRTGGRIDLGTTDQLIAGLERAVDPNGDGDTSDSVPVAVVGVSSPYAGFADSPEAVASGAARALGTLVVAPAGNEGRGGGAIGSPAAAPGVLAVGALDGGGAPALPAVKLGLATGEGRALLRGTLLGGSGRALRAGLSALTGPSQASPRERGRALGGSPLEYFAVNATPRARGRVVVVPARRGAGPGPALAARAAAAGESGAAALVVCEPDARRPLNALPGGSRGMPVIGLRGEAAARALELTPHDGGLAFLSAPESRTASGPVAPALSSSHGPTYALSPKPDLAARGTATLEGRVVTGTSVAAARAGAAAALLKRRRPDARPDDLAAALVETARPLGPLLVAGAGELRPPGALAARVRIEPATFALPRQPAGAKFAFSRPLTVVNAGTGSVTLRLAAQLPGLRATVSPGTVTLAAGKRREVTLEVSAAAPRRPGWVSGRVTATGGGAPISAVAGLQIGPPPPARLSALRLSGPRGRTDGVRFTAGAVTYRGGARSVEPLGNLRLQLVDGAGKVVRELTPPGGARDLLPGEYAYTLTPATRNQLGKGSYGFVARGLGPAGGSEVVMKSPSFSVR